MNHPAYSRGTPAYQPIASVSLEPKKAPAPRLSI